MSDREILSNRKVLHELLDAAIDVNGLEASRDDDGKTRPNAFFYFEGHVFTAELQIHDEGWKPGSDYDVIYEVDFDKAIDPKVLDEVREHIFGLLERRNGEFRRGLENEIEKKKSQLLHLEELLANCDG